MKAGWKIDVTRPRVDRVDARRKGVADGQEHGAAGSVDVQPLRSRAGDAPQALPRNRERQCRAVGLGVLVVVEAQLVQKRERYVGRAVAAETQTMIDARDAGAGRLGAGLNCTGKSRVRVVPSLEAARHECRCAERDLEQQCGRSGSYVVSAFRRTLCGVSAFKSRECHPAHGGKRKGRERPKRAAAKQTPARHWRDDVGDPEAEGGEAQHRLCGSGQR
jgi:hypothetical protein